MNEDPEVQKMLEGVVLHQVDAEKGEGVDLAKTHGVKGFPTFLMVNAEVQPVDRWIGYSKEMLDSKMTMALADLSTIEEKRTRFAATPTSDLAVRLAGYDAASNEYVSAVSLYRKAELLGPGTSYANDIFEATFSGWRREAFEASDVIVAADAAIATADAENVIEVCSMMTHLAKKTETPELRVKYLKTAIDRTKDTTDEKTVMARAKLMPEHALYVEKKPAKAVELRRAAMPEGWMTDADQLNTYAWWCFENGVDNKEALSLARQGVELAPAGQAKAAILDTAAELCNAMDNCHEAVDLTKLAVAEDPENEYYQKQLDRFQEILATK